MENEDLLYVEICFNDEVGEIQVKFYFKYKKILQSLYFKNQNKCQFIEGCNFYFFFILVFLI